MGSGHSFPTRRNNLIKNSVSIFPPDNDDDHDDYDGDGVSGSVFFVLLNERIRCIMCRRNTDLMKLRF